MTEEYDLGDGKRVDLHAQRNNREILIEIETGKSDVQGNIAKCQGRNATIVAFFTSADALRRATVPTDVTALCPETLERLHPLLRD